MEIVSFRPRFSFLNLMLQKKATPENQTLPCQPEYNQIIYVHNVNDAISK